MPVHKKICKVCGTPFKTTDKYQDLCENCQGDPDMELMEW